MQDRRGRMPVRELLDLRLAGVKVEDATTLLEKVQGKIQLDGLYPSALIFSEGFRIRTSLLLARRIVSITIASVGLVFALLLIPLVALAVPVSSPALLILRHPRTGRTR